MSIQSSLARALPTRTPEKAPERRLRPVMQPARRRRPKLAYALIALGGAMAIGAAQMTLSLIITQDSFVLAGLKSQQNELNLQTSAIQDELTGMSSPQMLATKADALGMVVAGSASYLRLSDNAVIGAGEGAGWLSTVDPKGAGAVHNSLLSSLAASAAADAPEDAATGDTTGDAATDTPVTPDLPPPITDGLPSPTTR